jgi:hypothetical protein
MLIRAFVLILTVFALCTGLIAGVRAIGQRHTPTPVDLATGDCAQPCWHGIRPGASGEDAFYRALAASNLYTGDARSRDGVVRSFDLYALGPVQLADALHVFGQPARVSCLGWTHSTRYPGRQVVLQAHVYFAAGLVRVEVIRPDVTLRLTPDMQVRQISYFAPGEPVYPVGSPVWRGFRSYPACY